MVSWRITDNTIHAMPMIMPARALLFWKPARREMMNATMLKTRPMVDVHGMMAKISPTIPSVLPGSAAGAGWPGIRPWVSPHSPQSNLRMFRSAKASVSPLRFAACAK